LVLTPVRRLHQRVWLLRGNHEDREVNALYGLQQFCMNLYGIHGDYVHTAFNEVFDWLPLAGLISGSILCVHGGQFCFLCL
jgi:diadenosine tetraphosphatase ApaH/serine/threonine PP2A family protein phosphatase